MFNFLNPYMLWIKLAGVAALMLVAAGATYYVKGNADTVKLQGVELAYSKAQTVSITASLDQLQGFISNMHTADANYVEALASIHAQFADLQKELHDATLKPLPVDCRPDAGRLHVLTDAVQRANKGAGLIP